MIYIVTVSGGEYDGHWTHSIAATRDHVKAQKLVETLEAEAKLLKFHAPAISERFLGWTTANPMPPRPSFMQVPTNKERKADPTLEAKYKLAVTNNAAQNGNWTQAYTAWSEKAQAVIDGLRKEYRISKPLPYYHFISVHGPHLDEETYGIEEVPELE